ncbi:MAG: phosphatase [Marinifilaceae bacterium]
MRIAIIDLGTNTFNLLVADLQQNYPMEILHRSKYASKIGKGGINNNLITDKAIERGLTVLSEMNQIISEMQVEKTLAFATSAIRSAKNGEEFAARIRTDFGFQVEIISGDREAELIYTGTKKAMELSYEKVAILDIGGGSNEIIIANEDKIFWKKSFPVGITRLLERFQPSEPITRKEIHEIEEFLDTELEELWEIQELYDVKTLIGSSGSFDTFKQMLLTNGYPTPQNNSTQFEIKLKDFFHLHQDFLNSTLEQRKAMPGMDMARVDLMVLASLFINYMVKKLGISKLYQSSYALKEGALFEMAQNSERNLNGIN